MIDLDPGVVLASTARHEERYEEALGLLVGLFARICKDEAFARVNMFIVMFEWRLLCEAYPPACDALARARDAQAHLLLKGDNAFRSGRGYPDTRFQLIAGINDTLGDPHSTRDLFDQMEARMPEAARGAARTALPAMVAAGDFERAERYLPDPLAAIDQVNEVAATLPLFPPADAAPRLAAELSNALKDLRLCTATLEGLDRSGEAAALRSAALARLGSDEMRELAVRELADPGTIHRDIAARRLAREEGAARLRVVQNPPG
ncbi:MAG: hypothetical protein ACXWC4_25755 [Telluria sp.]